MSNFKLAGIAFALGVATPAAAQYQQPPATTPMSDTAQAPVVLEPEPLEGAELWTFSRCLASREQATAETLLASQPRTEVADTAIGGLVGPTPATPCLAEGFPAGGLAIDRRRLRGSLAEALYLARHPDGPPAAVSSTTPTETPVEIFNARMTAAIDPVDEAIRIFADCVVANHALQVDALVRTGFGSAEEGAAIGRIAPSMGACLWEGRSIAFNAETLRAALADGLYRKANAIPAVAGGAVREAEGSER